MIAVLSFLTALVISMAIIPVAIRLAPRLGMVDHPDARKIHREVTPRTGGIGIVLGSLLPVFLWIQLDSVLTSFLAGALVLLAFGLLDDRQAISPLTKLIGQVASVGLVVYFGDIYVQTIPFSGLYPMPEAVGKVFTVFAIVGVINAFNVADGLDGLASGLTVISLLAITLLAFTANADASALLVISACVLGGLFGFLRYNTHPARVFMGDAGSQFLGYSVGFAVVYLTQTVNPALSTALPLLLLGLPIVDILVAASQRVHAGIGPFTASRHHLHHRLLDQGLSHYETVVAIYFVQIVLVTSAFFVRYESDWIVAGIYLFITGILFFSVNAARRRHWRFHRDHEVGKIGILVTRITNSRWMKKGPAQVVEIVTAALMICVATIATEIPRDFGVAATIMAALFILLLVWPYRSVSLVVRTLLYALSAFVAYLSSKLPIYGDVPWKHIELALFAVLSIAIATAMRSRAYSAFLITPTDYLILLILLAAGLLTGSGYIEPQQTSMVIKMVILFYGFEIILSRVSVRRSLIGASTLITLLLLSWRGLTSG